MRLEGPTEFRNALICDPVPIRYVELRGAPVLVVPDAVAALQGMAESMGVGFQDVTVEIKQGRPDDLTRRLLAAGFELRHLGSKERA